MFTKRILKFILIYLVVANSIVVLVYLSEFIYLKKSPSVKTYREFVLRAMSNDSRRFNNFKTTDDYVKLMNATTVDSVRFYFTKYTHTE